MVVVQERVCFFSFFSFLFWVVGVWSVVARNMFLGGGDEDKLMILGILVCTCLSFKYAFFSSVNF